MSHNIDLYIAKSKTDVDVFWKLFSNYISELALNASLGDAFDLDYFYSEEYKGAIENLRTRDTNPLKIIFIIKEEEIMGFLMYVTYFDEGGKCLLMEYYIESNYRNLGIGKTMYLRAEKHITEEGALYIELTPTNEANERFWRSVGYIKSMDLDEDNKHYYRKNL